MKPCDMLSPEKIAETYCISPVFAERAAHRFFCADLLKKMNHVYTKPKLEFQARSTGGT